MRIFVAALAAALFWATPAKTQTYRLGYSAAVLDVIELGTANFDVAVMPNRYAVRAGLRTSGLARLFDQTEITASSIGAVSGSALNWTRYDISHAFAGKFRRIQLTRPNGQVSAQISPSYSDLGARAASAAQQAASYDPLTGLVALGREIGMARACAGAVLVFDGRQHYRLRVNPRSQGRFNGGGYDGPALNCTLRYEPIAGYSASARGDPIPTADAWFALPAQPGFAPPLRLTVQTPLGAARLDLRSYEAR